MIDSDINDLIDQIPDQDGYEMDGFLQDLETALYQLRKRSQWLQCLEHAGVDNWEGYHFAYELAEEYGYDI